MISKNDVIDYKELIDTMNDAFIKIDNKGNFIYCNQVFYTLVGYTKKELIGIKIFDFFDKKNLKILKEQLSKRKKGSSDKYKITWKKKDGAKVSTLISPRPLYDKNKKFIGSFAVITDITDRERAEENLKKERYLMDRMIDSVTGIFYLFNKNGKFIRWNKNFETVTGYSKKEMKKITPQQLFTKNDWPAIEKAIATAFKSGSVLIESDFKIKSGKKIPYVFTGIKVTIDREDYIVGMAYDVSIQKKAEEKLKKSHELLEKKVVQRTKKINDQKEKLQELDIKKDQFISLAAHELKTPLTSIKGFVQLMENKQILSNKKKMTDYLNRINKNTDRLTNLVMDLLDSTKISLGKLKINIGRINSADIIKETRESMKLIINNAKITSEFTFEDDVFCKGDASRVLQILRNLIINAVHHTPTGGKISVKSYKKGRNVIFEVTDTGSGIPKSIHKEIFEKFFQIDNDLKKRAGGSGLGLSICKGLVEAMNGKIWIKSTLKKGSTFFFTLPIATKK